MESVTAAGRHYRGHGPAIVTVSLIYDLDLAGQYLSKSTVTFISQSVGHTSSPLERPVPITPPLVHNHPPTNIQTPFS